MLLHLRHRLIRILGTTSLEQHGFQFINRPDSVVMNSQRNTAHEKRQSRAVRPEGTGQNKWTSGATRQSRRGHELDSNVHVHAVSANPRGDRSLQSQASTPKSAKDQGDNGGTWRSGTTVRATTIHGVVLTGGASSPDSSKGDPPAGLRSDHVGSDARGMGAGKGAGMYRSLVKSRQLAGATSAAMTRVARGDAAGDSSTSLRMVSGVVAVLVLVVGAIYIKRLIFAGQKSSRDPAGSYSSLEEN